MMIPDLVIIGFGQSAMDLDLIETLRLIKPFKRIDNYASIETVLGRYSDINAMSVLVDDPDYFNQDLYILFLLTPKEQYYDSIKVSVRDIEKRINGWFNSQTVQVSHYVDKTLCLLCQKEQTEGDGEIPFEVVGSVWDVLAKRDEDYRRGVEGVLPVSDLSGDGASEDGVDHSLPDTGY
jgi:hypothetical protein